MKLRASTILQSTTFSLCKFQEISNGDYGEFNFVYLMIKKKDKSSAELSNSSFWSSARKFYWRILLLVTNNWFSVKRNPFSILSTIFFWKNFKSGVLLIDCSAKYLFWENRFRIRHHWHVIHLIKIGSGLWSVVFLLSPQQVFWENIFMIRGIADLSHTPKTWNFFTNVAQIW